MKIAHLETHLLFFFLRRDSTTKHFKITLQTQLDILIKIYYE